MFAIANFSRLIMVQLRPAVLARLPRLGSGGDKQPSRRVTETLGFRANPISPIDAVVAIAQLLIGSKLTLWNTGTYDTPSAFGSSQDNGPWPFILRASKRLARSLPGHVKTQHSRPVP